MQYNEVLNMQQKDTCQEGEKNVLGERPSSLKPYIRKE
jgi:hypothetical protein